MAAGFKTVEPLEYYRRFLKENCRPDGRELGEFRTTTVNIGSITTADGSALVKLGNTTVICGIKAEFAQPPAESTNKGYIVPNVDLPPLCSSRFRPGPPGEEAQAASQFIADVIENSEIIMKEDLCIAHGKLAWVLYCDFICLDYDGNILDACTFALLAALKNVQLPKVTINEETGLAEVDLKQTNPLNIRKHPVATSFAVFDDTILIVDPTAEEEDLATGTVTIVMDEEGRLCSVHKPVLLGNMTNLLLLLAHADSRCGEDFRRSESVILVYVKKHQSTKMLKEIFSFPDFSHYSNHALSQDVALNKIFLVCYSCSLFTEKCILLHSD
ncbi:exosome complex component RRP43 isoform X2 [Gopherus flavomarginatus]|uniref:exosome complex component RRP43 isoform X2 n=1 Tax=Gopherus flavomarginatus TaxID=286002 RepID=UPI0021CC04BB|nr:exosome complex component RRP43 isoform X2 [Gopherus flavomarginatus]